MTIRDVLADNFANLRKNSPTLQNLPAITKAGGGSNGTLGRLSKKETGVSIDVLEPLAKVFGIQPWQLLHPELGTQSDTTPQNFKPNQPPALSEQGPAAINNAVTDIASRRSVDGVDNALRVLADAINQLAIDNRDGVAGLLSSFGRNPAAPGTYAALLALLDSGNARRQADPLPKSSSLGGR